MFNQNDNRPLADRVRPVTFDEVAGQTHILGKNGILRRVINSGLIPNLIFYGPSGTGKSTVSGIIAKETGRTLRKLNATTASLADVKAITDTIGTMLAPNGVLLYLDEIQYFNKKQQQSLLEFMESGKITLIASTTENPYFSIYNALLSRSTIFEFCPLTYENITEILSGILKKIGVEQPIHCPADVVHYIASSVGGDARKAITSIELLLASAKIENGMSVFTLEDAKQVTQRSAMRYDRDGDSHYDILSAFQKSMRGSDPDASIHYLARLLSAGDLTSACRRLLVTACEDVGLAHPQCISIVKNCVDAALQIGLPEAQIPLAQAVLLVATSPKSNSAVNAISAAMNDLSKVGEIPAHLKDSHYEGAKKMGRGLSYKYAHDYPHHWVQQQYLPDSLKDERYYEYGENKNEQVSLRYWTQIKEENGLN